MKKFLPKARLFQEKDFERIVGEGENHYKLLGLWRGFATCPRGNGQALHVGGWEVPKGLAAG